MNWFISPLPVIIRNVRPFVKFVIFFIWIYIRGHIWSHTKSLHHCAQVSYTCSIYSDELTGCNRPINWNQDFFQIVYTLIVKFESCILHQIQVRNYEYFSTCLKVIIRVMNDFLGIIFVQCIISTWNSLQHSSFQEWKDEMIQYIFDMAKEYIGSVKRELIKEEMKMEKFLSESLKDKTWKITRTLPEMSIDRKEILAVRILTPMRLINNMNGIQIKNSLCLHLLHFYWIHSFWKRNQLKKIRNGKRDLYLELCTVVIQAIPNS